MTCSECAAIRTCGRQAFAWGENPSGSVAWFLPERGGVAESLGLSPLVA
jgi:hypothetical protein